MHFTTIIKINKASGFCLQTQGMLLRPKQLFKPQWDSYSVSHGFWMTDRGDLLLLLFIIVFYFVLLAMQVSTLKQIDQGTIFAIMGLGCCDLFTSAVL